MIHDDDKTKPRFWVGLKPHSHHSQIIFMDWHPHIHPYSGDEGFKSTQVCDSPMIRPLWFMVLRPIKPEHSSGGHRHASGEILRKYGRGPGFWPWGITSYTPGVGFGYIGFTTANAGEQIAVEQRENMTQITGARRYVCTYMSLSLSLPLSVSISRYIL